MVNKAISITLNLFMFNLDTGYLKRSKNILSSDSNYPSDKLEEKKPYVIKSYRSQDNRSQRHNLSYQNNISKVTHLSKDIENRKSIQIRPVPTNVHRQSYNKDKNNITRINSSHYMDRNTDSEYESSKGNFIIGSNSVDLSSDDNYNPSNPPILWTTKSVYTLDKIMKYINSTKLMKPLGYMVRYYINKYQPYNTENRISTVDKINMNRDSMILATICEIYLKKTRPKIKIIISSKLIYRTLGKIIHKIIDDNFSYDNWILDFREVYMINLITEVMVGKPNNDTIREIIKSSYYVTKYIIQLIENEDIDLLSYMDTLLTHAMSLNISILNPTQIREMMSIMDISRKLYLRILLVISYHMIGFNSIITTKWTKKLTTVKNIKQFKDMLSDDIMELIIVITGFNVR